MSEIVAPPDEQTPPVAAAPAPQDPPPPEPTDDDIPEAVEVAPGQKVVPVGVVQALRAQIKNLKPLAEKAPALEAELNATKPYADFLKANPHLLQAPKPQEPPPIQPQDDAELLEIARDLDLYDSSTGKPDVNRAAKIRDRQTKLAEKAAQAAIAPLQHTTWQSQAQVNEQAIRGLKDASGQVVDKQFVDAAIDAVNGALPEGERQRVLADPKVASLIGAVALGLQAAYKKPAPAAPRAPELPPLEVESAGGASQATLSDGSKRLAKLTGRTEAQWQEAGKRYKPGQSNVLE